MSNNSNRQDAEIEEPLRPNTRVQATNSFRGETPDDLSFVVGEELKIIKPDVAMYWYVAENTRGQRGTIPVNLVEVIAQPVTPPVPLLSRANTHKQYHHTPPPLTPPSLSLPGPPPVPPKSVGRHNSEGSTDEHHERVRAVTLHPLHTSGTPPHSAPPIPTKSAPSLLTGSPTSLTRNPSPPATSTPGPPVTGNPVPVVINSIDFRPPMPLPPGATNGPINRVTSPSTIIRSSKYPTSQSFVSNSGWFKPTVDMVLAVKFNFSHQVFRQMTSAVYYFQHKYDLKKDYVGRSLQLYNELTQMFVRLYEKPPNQLTPLEEELRYNSPDANSWNVRAWSHPPTALQLESAKLIVRQNSLQPYGMNKELNFECKEEFQKFCMWYTEERQKK